MNPDTLRNTDSHSLALASTEDQVCPDARTVAETRDVSASPAETKLLPTEEFPNLEDSPELSGLSQFELLSELGRGGMGVVYKARHRLLNRVVALKMISNGKHAPPEHRARFLIEGEAVARLHHPNIVHIYDIGEADGHPFVTLELLEGGSLADRLKGTTQPGRAAAELVATLASAMHAAHQAGIVHRDLKPSNVLFDRAGVPKIADFGLAKRLEVEEGQTQTGQIMGTPSYMAPEQAQGLIHEVGPPADVYALGAVLYEMLTGRPPFKGPNMMATLRQVVFDEVVPPSRVQKRISLDLETICLKCLEKEPRKRYGSAEELAEDLRRYLDGEPIRARRTPLCERGVKWARRRPVASTLMAVGLATVATLASAGIRYESLRRQRMEAEAVRLASLRVKTDQGLFEAQSLLARKLWPEAAVVLADILPRIQAEERLADLRTRADGLLRQAERGRAEQKAEGRDRQRYQRFLQLKKEALFYQTQFTGLDLSGNEEATRRSARAALDLFAAPGAGEPGTLAVLPASLSGGERAEIAEGCYELLLILVGATAEAAQGLRILEQAARLNPAPTRAYHLWRAVCLARMGDKGGADRERGEAARIEPSSALDHFLTGQERYNRGDWRTARRHLEAALRLQPDHFWAHCLSAVCCLQMNRPNEALTELNACLQREPDFAWLYVLRGYTSSLIAARERDEASNLPSARPDAAHPDESLQFRAAEADFARAWTLLEDRPGDELRYVLLVDRGLMWFQRRELDKAAADLRQAITLNDRDFQAHAALAKVELERGDPDAAIACYSRAIQALPNWAPLYRGRADVYLAAKDLTPDRRALALSDIDQAIAHVAPGDPVAARDHTNRARLLHLEGRDREALDACAAALKIAPDYAAAHLLRLRLLLELRRDDEVLRSCEVLLARDKPSADLYELRALARARLGDYPGAIDDDTKALGLRPDRVALLTRRGWLYLTTRSLTLSLRDFDRAIELDPNNSDAYEGRGSARVRLGDHRAAVVDAETALRLGTPGERLSYNAARIYAQAAWAVASEVRQKGRDAVDLAKRYEDRAVALMTESMRHVPRERLAGFYRQQVQADPALQAIARRLKPPPLGTLASGK